MIKKCTDKVTECRGNQAVIKNKTVSTLLCMTLVLGMSACSHQSKVKPSTGHIDGQNTSSPSLTSKPATPAASAAIPKPVTNSQYLPPPTPKAKEPVYSIVVYDTPVKEVLFAIARDSKLNIDIHPAIQGRVTLNAVDQTLPAILERLSKQVDLTYNVKDKVLTITPDQPVLRTYKVDYVNMSRDAVGFIGVDGQISSTGQSSSASGGTTSNTSGTGANNSSRTMVRSESNNRFWDTLEKNITALLAESDKEIIIGRLEADKQSASADTQSAKEGSAGVAGNAQKAEPNLRGDTQKAFTEYKTLFAANVISNREAGVISVRGTNKQHERVQEFLDKVLASAKRQVLIEATIVEVRLSDSFQAGIDWSRLNNSATNSGFQFRQQLGAQTNSINATGNTFTTTANAFGTATNAGFVAGYLNPVSKIGNIAASINLLEQFGSTKVLSSPKLMVLNNQTAVLKVVDNLVYFTVQSQQSQGSVGGGILSTVTTTPNTVPVGVVMSVTPQINDLSNVNINIRPTVSRVLGFKKDPNPNLTVESLVPEIQVREMESMLQILSGNTAVLGGLMQDDVLTNTDKVPGLSKVPGVGKVFTGQNDANRKTELVIFLRPTVIISASLESDELSAYKQYLPSQQLENTLDAESER